MTEVIKTLQLEDVFYYHDLVITSTGGDSGVRDRGLVESAYCSAFQTIPLYIVPRLFPFGRASLALPSIRRGSALLASLTTRAVPLPLPSHPLPHTSPSSSQTTSLNKLSYYYK